ncbi:MAG: glycosyltransferase family 4 protein [Mogibacterium sp.]|nr:glycosyltransferase family 4 protein [Mogibacterium sp.]
MNILYINHYAGSVSMGMEFRPYYLAKEWQKKGHKVRIIAADYSHLRKQNPVVSKNFEIQEIDGIEYQWIKTNTYEGNGVSRAITMAQFCTALMTGSKKIANDFKPDVVISSSTYPLDAYPARKIANIAKAKHIHEVHDMWPATLYEIGGMSKTNPFVVAMQIGENYAYKNCDELVSLLSNAKPYMVTHGLKSRKFHCLKNGIVESEWETKDPLPEEHRKLLEGLRNDGKLVVGYFGGHALSNALDTIIDVAKEMQGEKDIAFVLTGDGDEKARIQERVRSEKVDNVSFLPPIAKTAVPSLLELYDIALVTAANSPLYRFGICMNKIFDAMMAGIPIVLSVNADNTPVEEADCGIVVKTGEKKEIVDAVRNILGKDEKERKRIGDKGKALVMEKYTYESIANDFLTIMNDK